jgi:hypothetical protein
VTSAAIGKHQNHLEDNPNIDALLTSFIVALYPHYFFRSRLPSTTPVPSIASKLARAALWRGMAPARGSRARGRAGRSAGASRAGGRRGSGSREGASGPHIPKSSLVVTLRVRAAVQQLPSPPESTTTALSTTDTPSTLREARFAQAAGRTGGRRKTSMAPVRDPENVDGALCL